VEEARLSDRAVTLARQEGLLERAAQFAGARAAWNAPYSRIARRRKKAPKQRCRCAEAETPTMGPPLRWLFSRTPRKLTTSRRTLKTLPAGYVRPVNYLPALRALQAISRGDAAKALEMTHAAAPYDLAVPGTAFFTGAFFGALYPVYVRGLAYSQLRRPSEAAAEFQTILDHPGLVLNDPIGSMARLQLARALSASGDCAKSAAVHADLLTLWKDADPDIPVLRQAKAECARLQ
jgi:eukaryotic-like serine/threonine-protein kinase